MAAADRDERIKTLSRTLADIEKSFGKGSIMKLGDKEVVEMDSISTGSLGIDIALGIGGGGGLVGDFRIVLARA